MFPSLQSIAAMIENDLDSSHITTTPIHEFLYSGEAAAHGGAGPSYPHHCHLVSSLLSPRSHGNCGCTRDSTLSHRVWRQEPRRESRLARVLASNPTFDSSQGPAAVVPALADDSGLFRAGWLRKRAASLPHKKMIKKS